MGSAAAHNPIHGGAAPSHSVTFTGDLPATGTGASRKQPMGRSYTIRDNLTKVRHHWKLHEGNHRNGFRSFPIRRRFLVYALDFLFLGDRCATPPVARIPSNVAAPSPARPRTPCSRLRW